MLSRLRLQRACIQRAAEKHPAAFRAALRMMTVEGETSSLQPWQIADFAALDNAWLSLAGRAGLPKSLSPCAAGSTSVLSSNHHTSPSEEKTLAEPVAYKTPLMPSKTVIRRAYIERPRGHSKTTDMAIQCSWILQYARDTVQGLAAAADQDQAQLLHAAMANHIRRYPELCPDLQAQQYLIRNRRTDSRLTVISSDVNSSWGQLPDFVICDELCHWSKPDLWYSLCSSAAKKPLCVLAVLTNAGVGTGWQWNVREAARESSAWHFSSLLGPQAPWISAAALEEQRKLLPPSVYARLWENIWQHSDGEFVSLVEAEACCDPQWSEQVRGQFGRSYFAAVDYAEKHDRTVGVVVHREGEAIIVDRMDVAVPRPGQPVLVAWVEGWITRIAASFPGVQFVLDEYQLLSVLQRFSGRFPLRRFDFAGGRGNHALALSLRNLILHQRVRWYSGCGQLPDMAERDDLETELAALILRSISGGRLRIDHRHEPGAHDDRAFALGAACLEALNTQINDTSLLMTPPMNDGSFAW